MLYPGVYTDGGCYFRWVYIRVFYGISKYMIVRIRKLLIGLVLFVQHHPSLQLILSLCGTTCDLNTYTLY